MTNRELINQMTDNQLAEFTFNRFLWFCPLCELKDICLADRRNRNNCTEAIKRWLSMEATE